ncbi:T9SS type A sorting domain-containing protein [uncultured Chryseobacterium sp.]|uniref:T9SS type A sorting domain-containing protein n=1 Tax=uncultured Chryseobacterium sp. TaxID=259322 RepID=UPI0025EA8582|nr:T9SS type A sorting domain-containing protein [uncultured Chryseobacterium sp.]
MSIKKIFLLLMGCLYTILCAQGENDNWYFGDHAAVNFSTTTPATLNNNQMSAFEACGTASDENGNLLFYTNSQTIFNRQHQPMQNGTGILGNYSAQQLSIVKNPSNSKQYFVFVTAGSYAAVSQTNRISYSIVDMSLGSVVNGQPLGAVLQNFKNIPVTDNIGNNFGTEAITAVAGPTPNTYWVLIPNGNRLYSYRIDSSGFSNGNPVISNLNFPINLSTDTFFSIKASPKLSNPNFSHLICISLWYNNTNTSNLQFNNQIVSFNSNTGAISNNYLLTVNSIKAYLPEFNKNGSVLFLANTSVYAIDLVNSTTGSINFLQIFNGSSGALSEYTALQRNRRGDIYINKYGSNFLGIINNPDVYGTNMSVNMNSINLGSAITQYGLPQLIPESEPIAYYPCIDSLTLTYEPNLNFNYEVGNKIVTKTKYALGPRHNITMKAGNMVNLLPGTEMQLGANYHAYIAPCREKNSDFESKNLSQKGMILDLDKIERSKSLSSNEITISPNPASDFINIDSGKEKTISWELFDMSGRSVLKGNSSPVNVQSLPKANYILKINTVNKQVSKKVTVK